MLLCVSCWLLKTWAAFTVSQGHSSNVHHLMPANIQIIRTPAVPPQTFTSHLPRGMPDVITTVWQVRCLRGLEAAVCLPLICCCAFLLVGLSLDLTGAAAAAVMSSSKTVLRPASGAGAGPGQPTVQHIIHQTIQVSRCTFTYLNNIQTSIDTVYRTNHAISLCPQSRPPVTTSTAVLPTVVAPISATRTQSPVISPTVTHSAEVAHG